MLTAIVEMDSSYSYSDLEGRPEYADTHQRRRNNSLGPGAVDVAAGVEAGGGAAAYVVGLVFAADDVA